MINLLPDLIADAGRGPAMAPCQCQMMGLSGAISPQAPIPAQLPADGRFISLQHFGYLGLVIFGLLQDIDLVSLLLGKLRVASHVCSSCLAVRDRLQMLTQLALLPTGRVALGS